MALLTTLLLLAGCTTAAPASTTPPAPKEIAITLADGKAEPNGERVDLVRGQHLVLTITSDREDEVHVHGIDVEIPVAAGQTVTKDIVVDQVGRFEVESHEPALTILVLQVQ